MLAEELVFEPGVLDVTVTEAGTWSTWLPPGSVDEEGFRRRRVAGSRKGEPVVVDWVPRPGDPAGPAEITSPLVSAHVAGYAVLLRESGLEDVPWVKWSAPEPVVARAEAAAWRQTSREVTASRALVLPRVNESRSAGDQLEEGLDFDLALAALMGVTAAVDHLRRPLLERKAAGEDSTRRGWPASDANVPYVVAPNLTGLSWPDVVALHDDDAIGTLRARMAEFEREAVDQPLRECDDAIKDVGLDEAICKEAERVGQATRVRVDLVVGRLPSVSRPATEGADGIRPTPHESASPWNAVC
ncbi:MAG: hypothetical protein M3P44_07685 [Actinomycetota bacterium]|nr:hypothetical protein [Actinomycetota bacterium]